MDSDLDLADVPAESSDQLIARLQAENAELRSAKSAEPPAAPRRRPSRSRNAFATVLVVIGALLAPVGIAANWAQRELTDTAVFVDTFAPLAKDPAVQALVTHEVTTAIEQRIDISGLTSTVFDQIGSLGLSPAAQAALKTLEAPATTGIENLIATKVHDFVVSPQFETLWRELLTRGHTQMVGTLTGNTKSIVVIGASGAIGIQIGPIVEKVKALLIGNGLTFASRIPAIDKTIVVATSDAAARAQPAYALVVALGTWLPWLALLLLAGGVVLARRRIVALVLAGLALGASALLTLAAIGIGRPLVVNALSPDLMPADAAAAIYSAVVVFLASSALAVAVLAFSVALVGWVAGPFALPTRLRGAVDDGFAR